MKGLEINQLYLLHVSKHVVRLKLLCKNVENRKQLQTN